MSTRFLNLKVILFYWVTTVTSLKGLDLDSCEAGDHCSSTDLQERTSVQLEQNDTGAAISKPAPFWRGSAVVDGKVKEIQLTDYRGKYLVFFFYPLDFTFVRPTEVLALNDNVEAFREIGAEVVGVSVDSDFSHLAWINSLKSDGKLKHLKIPLLSDLTHEISRSYGVHLADRGHSLRGLFIIDPKGILRQMTLDDVEVGRSVEETLRLVETFKHVDASAELSPTGWTPDGQEAIVVPLGSGTLEL